MTVDVLGGLAFEMSWERNVQPVCWIRALLQETEILAAMIVPIFNTLHSTSSKKRRSLEQACGKKSMMTQNRASGITGVLPELNVAASFEMPVHDFEGNACSNIGLHIPRRLKSPYELL